MRHVFLHCDSPLPMAPGTSPYRIKGEFYRHLSELLAHLDERSRSTVDRALQNDRLLLFARQEFLASRMYDCLPFPRIVMAASRVVNMHVHELVQRMGESSWERQRRGVYSGVIGTMTIDNLARRFPAAALHMYDFGPVRAREEPGHVELTRDVPACIAEWWCRITVPFVSGPLRANGARGLDVTFALGPPYLHAQIPFVRCRLDVRWDPGT